MTDAQHAAERPLANGHTRIDFQTEPARYRHWQLKIDGDVATLLMDVDEKGALFEGYDLKLNSYDLGVDIELADAIERLHFEYPQVRVVVLRSGKPRVFCAGANIRMLAGASHAHKVNFCKFTNETRNGIEDLSEHSGLKTICAISGTAAGGGYELALAADHIMLVDDGSSAVALPELPLLAVLPGTGGLTRVADKRKVRRDHADVFCTTEEGVKGKRALDWRLVDEVTPGSKFDETIEIAINLGVDPRHADQMVRGVVTLPNGTGRTLRVGVFARGAKAEEAKAAGADIVGAEDLVEKVQGGQIDFDRCIATPDMMPLVGRLGKVLGPRGMMPNPKIGTVTMDVTGAVKGAKGGSVEFRVEKAGIVQAGIGKASFSEEKLVENVKALADAVAKAKPAGSKGTYIQRVAVSSTMGPGVKVEPGSLLG